MTHHITQLFYFIENDTKKDVPTPERSLAVAVRTATAAKLRCFLQLRVVRHQTQESEYSKVDVFKRLGFIHTEGRRRYVEKSAMRLRPLAFHRYYFNFGGSGDFTCLYHPILFVDLPVWRRFNFSGNPIHTEKIKGQAGKGNFYANCSGKST